MFKAAVLRLTLWYVLVVMVLSALFSVALYTVSTSELNDLQRREEQAWRARPYALPPEFADIVQFRLDQIKESKRHIGLNLAYFNVVILLASGAVSYFLALRTLGPIEEAMEAQKQFTADASHELRTPLTAMKTEIEVALRDAELSLSDSRALHESTLEEIGKLAALANGLLALAREGTHRDEAKHDVSVKAVVAAAVKRVAPLAKKREVAIESESVEEATVRGHEDKLVELLTILLDNAVKYSQGGASVTVRSRLHDRSVVISVQDQGVGIAADDIPHIFDRFFRADQSRTKRTAEGYGLGLSIAKKIVEEHRGKLEVRSELGVGSTFTVRLPLG